MDIPEARVNLFVAMFRSQHGAGQIPVYQGLARYQSGQGFGDFFRGLLRSVIPIALNVGKSALSPMADTQEHCDSFTDTLQSGIRPAATTALRSTVAELTKAQVGSGLKRQNLYKGKKTKKGKARVKYYSSAAIELQIDGGGRNQIYLHNTKLEVKLKLVAAGWPSKWQRGEYQYHKFATTLGVPVCIDEGWRQSCDGNQQSLPISFNNGNIGEL